MKKKNKHILFIFLFIIFLISAILFYLYIFPELGNKGRAKRFETAAIESLEKGETSAAVQLLRQALIFENTDERKLLLSKLLLADGNYDEASSNLETITNRDSQYNKYKLAVEIYKNIDNLDLDSVSNDLKNDAANNYESFKLLDRKHIDELINLIQNDIYIGDDESSKFDLNSSAGLLDILATQYKDEDKFLLIRTDIAILQNDANFFINNKDNLLKIVNSSDRRSSEVFSLLKDANQDDLLLYLSKELDKSGSLNKMAINILYDEAIKSSNINDANSYLSKGLDLGFFGGDKLYKNFANTNGNLNNQGFLTETDDYYFFTQYNTRALHRSDLNMENEIELTNLPAELISSWKDKVYFISPSSNRALYSISINGGEPEEIYTESVKDYIMVDGIIYFINLNNHHMYSLNIDNKELKQLGDLQANEIASDGLKLFFTDINRDNAISSIDFNGENLMELNNATSSSLNPSGGNIYYINLSSNSSIFVMLRDGKNDRPLPLPSNIKRLNVEENKDSGEEMIYFVNQGIYRSDVAGSDIVNLSTASTSDIAIIKSSLVFRNDDNNWVLTSIDKESGDIGVFDGD